jgi:hypothetical protein
MKRLLPRWPVFGLLICVLFSPDEVDAQAPPGTWRAPDWAGEVGFLGANALLGGITAGLLQELRGGSFQDGFTRGALGGALAYSGRRLAVEDFWGAGLVARQVSAVGASVVRNAAEQRPMFSRIVLVAGPLLLNIHPDSQPAVRLRMDAHTTVWMLLAVFEDRLEFDWSASFSAAAPVFRAPRHRLEGASGITNGGVVVLGRGVESIAGEDVFAHERVHVLQRDFGRELWGGPLERWAAGLLPGGRTVVRLVEPGVAYSGMQGMLMRLFSLDWGDRPWEIEAEFLEHR